MTIAATEELKSGPYNGNGVTTSFDYNFTITADADLVVTRRNADDTSTVLTLTTDYVVAGAGDAGGGSVTLTAGSKAPTGSTLTLTPDVDLSQTRPFGSQTSMTLSELEATVDKLTILVRQNADALTRAVKLPVDTAVSADVTDGDAARASGFVAYSATGAITLATGLSGSPTTAYTATLLDDADAVAARRTLGVPDVFDTVQVFIADTTLTTTNTPVGSIVTAQGFRYQAVASGGDITTAGGVQFKVLIKVPEVAVNAAAFDLAADGVTDDTSTIQRALDATKSVFIPAGIYLIDPSVSLVVDSDHVISGAGRKNTVLLAKYDTAGDVFKRTFDAAGTNAYVNDVVIKDMAILLNHAYSAGAPTNKQVGANLSNITRSCVQNCYIGNNKFGAALALYPNGTKQQMAQGVGVLLGNVSASDPAYAGGEVNTVRNCRIISAEYGVGVDLSSFTGGASASYAPTIEGNDIQSCRVGIAQESQYGAGGSYLDNTIQDAILPTGITADRHHVYVNGYNNTIGGGYFETTVANLTSDIKLGINSKRNTVNALQHSHAIADFLIDLGSDNAINTFDAVALQAYNSIDGADLSKTRMKAYVAFDNAGTVLKSYGLASVVRSAAGDYNINWGTGTSDNDVISVTCKSTASRPPFIFGVTMSGVTTRLEAYSVDIATGVATKADALIYYVTVV